GEGGMGKIYLSRHITLGKKYAVKMLNPEFSNNQEAIERFRREAVTAGELEHPNIINVTDIDYTREGQAYIVMEFLDGCELRDILREEPVLPFQRLLRILYQVSRALDAAHSKGIIHRDLKPENIFVIDRSDQKDVVKILDFGISKIKGGKGGTNLTQTGMVIGTPHYMAPEQARGDKDIDHRVDIYALGSIAYEMFTGKLPVNGDSPTAILMKILLEEPPQPETLNPNINPTLSLAIRKAMSKDPNDRFSSCMQFVESLRDAAQIQSTAIRTSSFAAPAMQVQTPPPPGTLAPGMAPGMAPPATGVPVISSLATPPPATGTTPMTWAGTGAMTDPHYQPKKRSSAVFIVLPLIVLFLAGGAVGAYFLMTSMDKTKGKELKPATQLDKDTKKEGDTAKKTEKETKSEDPSKKAPAKDDDKAIIKFNTTPKGATVMLKIGVVERELCETTCEHEFNKSSKDVKLVFTKSGYQDEEVEISPDVPYKEILIKLTQKGKKKKSKKADVQVVTTTPEKPAWVVTNPQPPPTEKTADPKDKKKAPVIRIIDNGEKKPDNKKPDKKKPVIRLIPNK
ncbi:MAG: protein kinase, partial [Pseudomonadota bacterium]